MTALDQTHVFHRQLKSPPPTAVKGDGPYLIDADGKRYLDASGGAAVSCLGHSDQDVIQAVKDQADKLAFAHTGFLSSEPAEKLAAYLAGKAPDGVGMVYFVSGGSEANEAALKMARQYFLEIGQPNRVRFIARQQSYHGNTLGALGLGGSVWRREPFQEMIMQATHIPPCYPYRHKLESETDRQYGIRAADALEMEILRLGPGTVAAFCAETVGGATAGVLTPPPGYFKRIREICDKYGVLLILDEVMCGMSRTGTMFACEQDGVAPDLICVAKGLGAGYQPIGAALASRTVYDALKAGSGAFRHGHTYIGHPIACAAALAVQEKIERLDLRSNVLAMGDVLVERLNGRFGDSPHLGEIRGRGLFRGIELVADRATKATFDPSLKLHAKIKKHAFEGGLICYPGGGTADGTNGDHILLAPPFTITEDQVDELVRKLGDAVDAALDEAGVVR